MLSTMPVTSDLSPQARFLIEYDPDGHRYSTSTAAARARSAAMRLQPVCPFAGLHRVHPALYDGTSTGQQGAWPLSARRR
jgi:two-component system sensor histidine kinase TctE